MTQMPPLFAPRRAAWEEAAAAGLAEGGRPARPARGKRRHLLFPRSFPAAPSETQPAGGRRRWPVPLLPRPGIGLQGPGPLRFPDTRAGRRQCQGKGEGQGQGQGQDRAGWPKSLDPRGPAAPRLQRLQGRKPSAGEDLARGEMGPGGEGRESIPTHACPAPLPGLGDRLGGGLCLPTTLPPSRSARVREMVPSSEKPAFFLFPARWPGHCPPPALYRCKPGRNAEG